MRNVYKNGLVAILMAIGMISAQGVEAKYPPKTKQSNFNHHYRGYGHHKPNMVFHQGRMFIFKNGVFYTRGRYGFREVLPPIGMRVNSIPRYAKRIETYNGVLFRLNGTFYKRARRGYGFVVVDSPFRGYSHRRGHGRFKGGGRRWDNGSGYGNQGNGNQGNGNQGNGKGKGNGGKKKGNY